MPMQNGRRRSVVAPFRSAFADGAITDVWLGAYAELIAGKTRQAAPDWAFDSRRISPIPWFAEEPPALRALADR